MPVMPDDEPLDYLITQTIADYLANKSEAEVDGIIYPSAQGSEAGLNIVLFHKAGAIRPHKNGKH
jgi:RES domain